MKKEGKINRKTGKKRKNTLDSVSNTIRFGELGRGEAAGQHSKNILCNIPQMGLLFDAQGSIMGCVPRNEMNIPP